MESLLRQSWDCGVYLRGSPELSNKPFLVADDGSKAHLQRINQIMASDFDWSTMAMICLLAQESEIVGAWSEGCGCHIPPRRDSLPNWCPPEQTDGDDVELIPLADDVNIARRRRRNPLTHAQRESLKCPFRCCRSPELATGKALILQKQFMGSHKSRFNNVISKLPSKQKGELASAWTSSCSKLIGTMPSRWKGGNSEAGSIAEVFIFIW
jgi:hypothetical protein